MMDHAASDDVFQGAEVETAEFSLRKARRLVGDLFRPSPWIYWLDILLTGLVAHASFQSVIPLPEWLGGSPWQKWVLRLALFAVSCGAMYRGVMFVHELVHLPPGEFKALRIVWNGLFGVPSLLPTFTYFPHLDHHRQKHYGTMHDGEYLPFAHRSGWRISLFLLRALILPLVAILRFTIVQPLTWISPRLRQWVYEHASTLVINSHYLRPPATEYQLRLMRKQEMYCLGTILTLIAGGIILTPGRFPLYVLQAYLTAVLLVTANFVRTIASHRWENQGSEMTFLQQMEDSVTIDSDLPWEVLLNPVGLRYHTAHHLFPSLPYHNLRTAHKRLLENLPPDSPYRRTVEPSLWSSLGSLWRRAARNRQTSVSVQIDL